MSRQPLTVYTVGHSSRTLSAFVELLGRYGIRVLADIRRFPTSKAHPHFNRDVMEPALQKEGIDYVWLGDGLGGYRKDGYEAHTRTAAFKQALDRLTDLASVNPTAAMCAERHWSRCHRKFVSDRLVQAGHRVIHLIDENTAETHRILPEQLELKDLL